MRFELLQELGRGGTGVVFKARDREPGTLVALKRLHSDKKFAEMEVLLARAVSHPNVCRVYDLLHEDGHTWISMELVDGETLQAFLKRSGPLSIDETLRIARQIMDGLEAAHRLGIVHRDLNPENILIAHDGTVKITDFGIARMAGRQDPPTTQMDVSGTPGYMAPEQIMGLGADARTDLYALGFILYQMVYNVPGVPPWFEAAITCCTQKDPEQRYASVAGLRAALRGPRRTWRVASYTSVVAACLVVFVSVWSLSWKSGSGAIPVVQAPPAVAHPVPQPVSVKELPTLAVLFEGPVGEALANAILRGGKFSLVERVALQKALSELQLKNKVAVDPANARQVGKVVGAEYFMVGSSQMFLGQLHINAKLVETETTRVILSEGIAGDPKDALKLAEELAARFHL